MPNQKSGATPTQQQVCIDLPGETVRCWRSSDNIQVVLRKHRDVIFELSMVAGRRYKVESTGSDFYNANKRKLIEGKNRQFAEFIDGEKFHVWIARDFIGEILLKFEDAVLLKIDPAKIDKVKYDENPKTKPSPIVVTLGAHAVKKSQSYKKENHLADVNFLNKMKPVAAPVEENCPLICVVDGTIEGIPSELFKIISEGGGRTGLIDLDPSNIATRNWILSQIAGSVAYVGDNWTWLKASFDNKTHAGFRLVKAKVHFVRGKVRFYFSGYSRSNSVFRSGGFGPSNDRIMSIFGGAGDAASVLKSTAKGIAGTFKGNALVSFIFGSATAFAEWKADASKDGFDLMASVITSAIKSILIATITIPIVLCLIFLIMFAFELSMSVLSIGAATIFVGVCVGYAVDVVDKKIGKAVGGESNQDGIANLLAEKMRESISYNWNYLKRKLLWDYEGNIL